MSSKDDTDKPSAAPVTNEQIMAALNRLTQFATAQQATNVELQGKQAQLMSWIENLDIDNTTTDNQATVAVDEVKEAAQEAELERDKQRAVRESRKSVHISNSNNNTLYTGDLMSPAAAPPARLSQTEAEISRRQSRLFSTPAHSSKIPASSLKTKVTDVLPSSKIDKSRNSSYYDANQAMSKIDKFYGDQKSDKSIDVYTFVRGIDFQLDRFMNNERFGKLELVISCTGGAAQMWLLNKRHDLATLLARGAITEEMTEWEYVREEFIENMGGGQTQRLHLTKLEGLKLGRGGDNEEVAKFISKFREYAFRAFPLDKYPDTTMRSLMLGRLFESRVSESDWTIWAQMVRTRPRPETLEDMEDALTSSWGIEQTIRAHKLNYKKSGWNGGGQVGKTGNGATPSQAVLNLEVAGETSSEENREEGEAGESLHAVAAKKPSGGGGEKRSNNKHIDGKKAAQLMRLYRCLHCYKNGHYARDCKTPANRPPTESELKA